MKNRFIFHYVFLRSIFLPSFSIGATLALFGLMASLSALPASFIEWTSYFLSFIPYGLIIILFYKEMAHNEQYYFYYNQGITKYELWIVSFVLFGSLYIIFNSIVEICRYVLK